MSEESFEQLLNENGTVYAVQDGTGLYHRYECDKMAGWSTAFSLEKAIGLGFQPCPECCN